MTRKDFVLVADTLAAQYTRDSDRLAVDRTVLALADAFAATYPNFQRSKFLHAAWSAPGVAGRA